MVKVDQPHNLQRQTQKKGVDLKMTVIFLCGCVNIIDVEKQ